MKNFYSTLTKVLLIITFFASGSAYAQVPQFFKGTGTATSTTPLNVTATRTQQLYRPSDFGSPSSGYITRIYMRNNTANPSGVYNDFKISFLQNALTQFSDGTFLTGTTLVHASPAQTITGNATVGGWFFINLLTPYLYDNTKSLIVEISYTSKTGGITTYTTSATTGVFKRISSTDASMPASGTTSVAYSDFGFDIAPVAACTPPTSGNAYASTTAPVCPATTVTLNVANHTFGTGQTYTWESSSTSGGTYALVNGPSANSELNVNPTVTTFYRVVMDCGGNKFTSTPVEVSVKQPLNGGYTIDSTAATNVITGGRNFISFTEALSYLSCGVSGPVVFDVTGGGPYNEQVIINNIPGASTTNTITFKGNLRTLSPTTTSAERAIIKLNGAKHVIIDGFTITSTATLNAYAVQLLNDADSNTIRNCVISMNAAVSSSTVSGIVINSGATGTPATAGDSKCDANTIMNNKITGGNTGIAFTADGNTSVIFNNKALNNEIIDFNNYGIYVNGNQNLLIEGNDIKRPTRTTSLAVFYGVFFSDSSSNCVVNKNRIHSSFDAGGSSTSVGIQFNSDADATAGNENIVTNNLIYHFTSAAIHYGIQTSGGSHIKFYHNTIALENEVPSGSTAPTRGFYVSSAATTGIDFRNNIIRISREGTSAKIGIEIASGASVISNNNDIFVSSIGGVFGAVSSTLTYTTITEWRNATGLDVASKSIDPGFPDATNGDLKPTANALNNIGAPVGILTDFVNVPRNQMNPDPGAFEFDAGPCSTNILAGTTIVTASTPVCPGNSITLDLENNSVGSGQTYTWQSSTTLNGTYTDISSPSSSSSYTFVPTSSLYYRANINCGAASAQSAGVLVNLSSPLTAGPYSINPGGSGGNNFTTFNAAILALSCGVTGPVTITVTPGNYNEQVIIPAIPNMSATNRITFLGNGAVLEFSSAFTGERATLKLNGTDYITIDNLTINANSAADFGYAIQIMGDADSNIIRNCSINASQSSTSTNFGGIIISGSATSATSASLADNNVITGNSISGGYYGIAINGSTTSQIAGNKIINNQIRDFYTYGIYISGNFGSLVENNDIHRAGRSTSIGEFRGIYFSGGNVANQVLRNRIHDPYSAAAASTTSATGIYSASSDGEDGNDNIVANNLIYNFISAGVQMGIYNSGSSFIKYLHNTISLDDVNSVGAVSPTANIATWGFHQITDATGIEFRNNIISITRGGINWSKRGLFYASAGSQIISNNNVIYVNATGGTVAIAASATDAAGTYETLEEWQTYNGGIYDQRSKSVNPLFINPAAGDFTPTESSVNNLGAKVGIATDIINVPRFIDAPDPGAYEFANMPCSGSVGAGTVQLNPLTPVCAGTLIKLRSIGYGIGGGVTYQWESSTTLNGTYSPISIPLHYPDYNVGAPTTSVYYRLTAICGATRTSSSGVQLIVKQKLAGPYQINPGSPTDILSGGTNFNSFADATSWLSCGVAGAVTFNVSPSTYNEQVIINNMIGTSPTSRVTFNGSGATISYLSGNTNERATVKLNGADYVTFNNFTINTQGASTTEYGYGIQLINDADFNEVNNCIINIGMPTSVSSTSYAGIVVNSTGGGAPTTSGDSQCDNNIFSGNTITGGSVGIALTANSLTAMINNNKVLNNSISEFYTTGIHLNGNNNALIEGNNIHRTTRPNGGDFRGINLENGNLKTHLNRNRIHDPYTSNTAATTAAIGIRLSSVDATTGNENIISNNFIYNFIGGTGTQNGILINNSDNGKYLFNTIRLDDAGGNAGNSRAIYVQTTGVTGLDIRNNIMYMAKNGPGEKQCLYFEPTSVANYTISNNLYYNNSTGSLVEIVRTGSTAGNGYPSLVSWQNASGKDAGSVEGDPLLASATDFHISNASPAKDKGVFISTVLTDIEGDARPQVADIGADEIPGTLVTYTFIGAGNFSESENWSNNTPPPSPLPAYSEVIINGAGDAILDIPFVVNAAAKITIKTGKNLLIQGNLTIQ